MAKFTITSPDGQKFTVNAPDGATQEQVMQFARAQFNQGPKETDASKASWDRMTDPTSGMSGSDKFFAGAGKAITDIARGAGQFVGLVNRGDVAESRKLDAPLMNSGAGTAGNVAGNVAALASTARIPGVNTIAGGAAVGSLMGLLQPSTSTGETVGNLALGALLVALFLPS